VKGLTVVVGMVACGPTLTNTPKPEFWPDAPKPRAPQRAHLLAYQPDHVVGLSIHEVTVMRSGNAETTITSSMRTRYVAGANPLSRDQFLAELHVETRSGKRSAKFSADHDSLTSDDGHGHVKTAKRGDQAFTKMADQFDRPRFTVTFEANKPRAINWDPQISAAPSRGAIIPFVELPSEPPTVGGSWTSITVHELPNHLGPVAVTFELRYLGDSECPSAPTRTCAQIALSGRSEDTPIIFEGRPATITKGYEGKLFFDFEAGIPDELRIHSVIDLDLKIGAIDLDTVLTIIPVAH
jgi:hypothetical protein